ncbi:MAG: hypothetical protein WBM68_05485 [Woeseia sp.]
MNERAANPTPLLLMPFVLLWRILGFVITLSGRIVCALLGLILMIAGVVLTMSVVAAPIGIPVSIFGFLLLIRALF